MIGGNMEKNYTFKGFDSPNSTQVPDQLFDRVLAHLNGGELKVLLYIIRRTFGFKKNNDNISIAQISRGITTKKGKVLDNGTGLSKSSVVRAVKGLLEKKVIIAQKRSNKKKGDLPTTYALNVVSPVFQNRTRGVPLVAQGGVSKENTQYTALQQTVLHNVNVDQSISEKSYKTKALVLQMLDILGDEHSKNFYRMVAEKCPDQMIFIALSEVKDTAHRGKIKKSKGALFTDLIKRNARKEGIELS